jgi:hypothetical protein
MNIVKATRQFESWLGSRTDLIKKDIRLKHANMSAAVFPFVRATYYRWAQVWPQSALNCPRARTSWRSETCTSRISEHGGIPRGA